MGKGKRETGTVALVRPPSDSFRDCIVTFRRREPIGVDLAREQHRAYRECLGELGARVVELPEEPELPDAVFVEDAAVVFEELAVTANPGALSRRAEVASVAEALGRYRPLECIRSPGTLDGGDVVTVGRTVLVGRTTRTNAQGIAQLEQLLSPLGYEVRAVPVSGCLHLKSACTALGDGSLLVSRSHLDANLLSEFQLVDVPQSEPAAADVLVVGDTVVMPAAFPATAALLRDSGREVRTLDLSEFQKAEGGVTCLSIVF